MDPHHTFLRVHARLSGMLAQLLMPRNRSSLRLAIVLLGVLTVMHVNFVAQAGYANELSGSNFNELSGSNISESQLLQIKLGYANELQGSNISECQLVPLEGNEQEKRPLMTWSFQNSKKRGPIVQEI